MRISAILSMTCAAMLAVPPVCGAATGGQFTSFAGFKLGAVTLSQVTKELGHAVLRESGDAGGYMASVCYRTSTGVVYFLSDEMGGNKHYLLGFRLSWSASAKSCANWPLNRPIPKLRVGGLRLGLTKAQFRDVIGTKIRWDNDVAYGDFQTKRMMTTSEIGNLSKGAKELVQAHKEEDYVDVTVSIAGVFKAGKLNELKVWKIESL